MSVGQLQLGTQEREAVQRTTPTTSRHVISMQQDQSLNPMLQICKITDKDMKRNRQSNLNVAQYPRQPLFQVWVSLLLVKSSSQEVPK